MPTQDELNQIAANLKKAATDSGMDQKYAEAAKNPKFCIGSGFDDGAFAIEAQKIMAEIKLSDDQFNAIADASILNGESFRAQLTEFSKVRSNCNNTKLAKS